MGAEHGSDGRRRGGQRNAGDITERRKSKRALARMAGRVCERYNPDKGKRSVGGGVSRGDGEKSREGLGRVGGRLEESGEGERDNRMVHR